MSARHPPRTNHLPISDQDLDDDELWAVIDSAAASRSRAPLLLTKPKPPEYGEVVEEERWGHHRPQKLPRLDQRMAPRISNSPIVTSPPVVTSPPMRREYTSPRPMNFSVTEVTESPPSYQRENGVHCLSGMFPSVPVFKQFQNSAMAILEPTDYTMISGHPFIKKSGWRKIAFYFNVSFEIRDRSIDYDENRNVQHAEFWVRAYMQGGRFCDGSGTCDRREKRFNKPNQEIPSTAETRAKNKACQDLLGIGEYRSGVKI